MVVRLLCCGCAIVVFGCAIVVYGCAIVVCWNKYKGLQSLIKFGPGKGLEVALVEESQVVVEVLHGVVENGLGLIEGYRVDEVVVFEVHLVDAGHYAVQFLLLPWLYLLCHVRLVQNRLLASFVAAFLLASHSNIKYNPWLLSAIFDFNYRSRSFQMKKCRQKAVGSKKFWPFAEERVCGYSSTGLSKLFVVHNKATANANFHKERLTQGSSEKKSKYKRKVNLEATQSQK